MLRALWLRVLWAPALVALLGCGLLAVETQLRLRLSAHVQGMAQAREQLDRVVLRLSERHARTVRRAREALLDPRPANQIAILSWTAEHYLQEMERFVAEGKGSVHAIVIPDPDPRWNDDVSRLDAQLDILLARAQDVAPTLSALLDAVSATDADALLAAQHDFDRADKEMYAALRVTERMVQHIATWQGLQAALPETHQLDRAWLALWVLLPLSLYLAWRPLSRLRRLAAGEAVAPRTDEERHLAARLERLASDRAELESRGGALSRDAEQAVASGRRAERELALFRLYNDNLMSSLRSAIVVTDAAGRITGFNRAARSLLGLDAAAEQQPIADHPLYRALSRRAGDARAYLNSALSDRTSLRFEAVPYAESGEVVLDLTIAPYLDESGAARGLLFVADDVTDAVRTKNQLLAAERLAAVGTLSAQVAHEIRNPLSAIALNAELLEDDFLAALKEPRRAEAQGLLRAIASEVERLTQVTEGYLSLARTPAPHPDDADLNQVVADLFAMLGEELRAHRIDVVMDLATPAPHAWADPGQIRQALLNIVRNSREAMPKGGEIRVATRVNGTAGIIEISDTGSGIPAEVVPRVFEPFFTTKPDGTGLGLSLTQQIMAQHGGAIAVNSQPPGGTTVRLSLPRVC